MPIPDESRFQLPHEAAMSPALPSQSFRSAPAFELSPTVREVIAAMPIVIFFNAVREAFLTRRQPAPARRTGAR
jgi:hypothetical protein